VPKILVADDNSNIQKMVSLALAEHHMEVVAVGNGEVAVRRLPDVKPDLILADVFMPVRNGYEVCEFVKNDPLYAHIPVILLVGAFDPLDEKEAHRVAADGILKKPFVPPDPLIAMVVATLERCKNASIAAHKAEAAAALAAAPPPTKQVNIPLPPPPGVLYAEPGFSSAEDTHQMGPGRADLIESEGQQMGADTTPGWRRQAMDLHVPDGVSAAAFEASVSESDFGGSSAAQAPVVDAPAFLEAAMAIDEGPQFHAPLSEVPSIDAPESTYRIESQPTHPEHSIAPAMAAAAPANWPEPVSAVAAAHEVAVPAPEPQPGVSSGNGSGSAGWMNMVAPAPPMKNPSGWTVFPDSGSVPSVPYRPVTAIPRALGAPTGISVAAQEVAGGVMPTPRSSTIAAEMSRLFSGLAAPIDPAAVAADAAAIAAAPPVSSSPVEVTASEDFNESREEAAAEIHASNVQFAEEESSAGTYDAAHPREQFRDEQGPSLTAVESAGGAGMVTAVEGMTEEGSSQYTIGPTDLEVEDTVARNAAGSPAADMHSPLENAPEPPPREDLQPLHADMQASPAAAAPAPAHVDIDAAVMEAAVKRVLERLEPHLHEILSHGVLRPLIENALQKELGKK